MNPILKKLGYPENARVVILHADDIGMCQASVDAYTDLLDAGIMSSAATMTPCPWYPAAAEIFCAQQSNPRFDIGVHCTLNSEWKNFRWGALSTRDSASGFLDADGYFYSMSEPTQDRADPDAVEKELTAQVKRALAAGYDVTHMDTHMLTLFHPRLLPPYLRVAEKFRLPAFVLRAEHAWYSDMPKNVLTMLRRAEQRGMPTFDHFDALDLTNHKNRLREAKRAVDALPVGLSALVFHPCRDGAEVRAMAPDWKCRVADHKLFLNEKFRALIAESGVHVIGYRTLRDAMRNHA